MQLRSFEANLPKPYMVMINGARGSGKDATAHQLARVTREKTGSKIYINLKPKKYDLPKYFKRHRRGRFVNDSILYLTDVSLEYYATEWGTDKTKTLVRLMNISRHKNISMIWTTLLAVDVPLNTIRRMDASIYKEPVFRAEKFERYALRDEVEEARKEFMGKSKREKQKTAVAFTQYGKFVITDISLPFYWTEELSKAHAGYQLQPPPTVIKIKNKPENE